MKSQEKEPTKKKNDFLLGAVLVLCAILVLGLYQSRGKEGGEAVIYVDGIRTGSYPLSQDADIMIAGTNRLIIAGGKADITEADCPDGLCVRQPAIHKQGESLVCLPNRIVVTVEGTAEEKIDAQAY